ncbi:50S ribosomal protein L25/general stress protein Ctc [Phreatobacter stygius]|uniref:Large ribosomal subunit protein bL25 n=1 Tax=Phreatobacter stygius TaxID=1940610 RepID=A0A4D7AX81_9HYPH|nr:50S ribosomal protein L25/general stress protein Ctc [Phreatobacter stygius]QCI63438.1 50S ribosomal protein L25/general stress protein Ctc [Phreatobacter stygius]
MAAINQMSATVRANGGKGAARAERRLGRVPGVIYGDKKSPVLISLDYKTLHQRIYAGHFLSTVFELEVDGQKHRVIPRDYQLDPVKDFPIHVDFLRLGVGAEITVDIPIHVKGADVSPGVKRGGAINLVEHSITLLCKADSIPEAVDIDVSELNLGSSIHLNDIVLPAGARATAKDNPTLLSIVAPSGFAEPEETPAADAPAAAAAAPAAKK